MRTLYRLLPVTALLVIFVFTLGLAKESDEDNDRKDRPRSTVVEVSKTSSDDLSTGTPGHTAPTAPEAGEQINWWVIGGGGGTGTSTSYQLSGTIGQPAVGIGSSASYQIRSGYWQTFLTGPTGCCVARVGDANTSGDDEPTIGDISVLIDAKFITGTCTGILDCLLEADINQSGGFSPLCDHVTIGDISYLIDYLFITGPSLGLNNCL